MKKLKHEDFLKAQKTIRDYYAQDFKNIHGKDRPCILCDKTIKPIHPESMRFPQSGMWSGGIVDKISAGYGSDKDGNMYFVAFCDKCVDNLIKKNKIEYAGNYMNMY